MKPHIEQLWRSIWQYIGKAKFAHATSPYKPIISLLKDLLDQVLRKYEPTKSGLLHVLIRPMS